MTYFKNFGIIITYLILILYSLEFLTLIFLKKEINLNQISFDELKKIKIDEYSKTNFFEKRTRIENFLQEKDKFDLKPTFRYSGYFFNLFDQNNMIKNFIQKRQKLIPFRGPLNSYTLGNNEDGVREIIFNDMYGFKNKNTVYQDKIDLMIIGDSFTEGVPFGNDIHVANLINNKSDYNALNYGVSGTGPLMSLGIVKEYGKHFYPKDIFYLFYEGNDLTDMMHEKETFLINYLQNDNFNQNLIRNSDELEVFFSEYEKVFYNIVNYQKKKSSTINNIEIEKKTENFKEKIKDFLELNNLKELLLVRSVFNRTEIDYHMFRNILNKMQTETKSWGGNLHFLYLPSWIRYNNKFSLANFHHQKKIEKIVLDLNINYIDIVKKFKQNKMDNVNTFHLGIYGHYKKKGYELISNEILNQLKKN
jgi:hypothetical protein